MELEYNDDLLNERDINEIKTIILGGPEEHDRLLWKFNSKALTTETQQPVQEIVMILWCLWKRLRASAAALAVQATEHVNRWQPPPRGKLKCNIDAAIFAELNMFGVGMCLRNDTGQFVKAKTRLMEGTPPPLEAEAMGLREALNWLCEMEALKVSYILVRME
ncbi:hypothetical protein A2U01_0000412 [Trifolium medium]|uniref:Uncharacterized protein n=1 Tax=Trifolium medium TaxID=97028 RepID=A0A392LXI2_9FABA|nr:hypothetical protein [Trifolium medium]